MKNSRLRTYIRRFMKLAVTVFFKVFYLTGLALKMPSNLLNFTWGTVRYRTVVGV